MLGLQLADRRAPRTTAGHRARQRQSRHGPRPGRLRPAPHRARRGAALDRRARLSPARAGRRRYARGRDPRAATGAQAPGRGGLRHDAGDDDRNRPVRRRDRRHRPDHPRIPAHHQPGGRDAGAVVRRPAVLRRRAGGAAGAPYRHGRTGRDRHRARLRRQHLEHVHPPGRCLLRLGHDVHFPAAARSLRRDAGPTQRRLHGRGVAAPGACNRAADRGRASRAGGGGEPRRGRAHLGAGRRVLRRGRRRVRRRDRGG